MRDDRHQNPFPRVRRDTREVEYVYVIDGAMLGLGYRGPIPVGHIGRVLRSWLAALHRWSVRRGGRRMQAQ